jgi:hypothetical protein
MAGKTGTNDPGGRRPREQVRHLQRRLWAAAKQSPGRRFHALYDHIHRSDVLLEAWRRVRSKRGAAGVDGQAIAEVERSGVALFLEEIGWVLRAKRYRPEVVLRRYIPKANGRKLTPRSRCHTDLREVIADLNPVLRGWGTYFRTGNAAKRFNQLDTYVWRRLHKLRLARKGRNLEPGEAERWTRESFWNLGLHRLRGTVRYPEAA